MSNLYVIGDIHGRIPDYLSLLDSLPKDAQTFALGDLYLGRPGVSLPAMESRHRFITGKHDSPSVAQAQPNFAGRYGFIADHGGIFSLSGAFTISVAVLQNSAYWYKDEELSPAELAAALELYGEKKPRVLVSHEGPAQIVTKMLSDVTENYYEAKQTCFKSRTAAALQSMIETHPPEQYFFAHHHRRWARLVGSTTFRCLKELEVCEAASRNSLHKS